MEWNNHAALVPVGKLEDGKSPYGIYDMAGNVWEWVSDWYDPNYYKNSPSQNPAGPSSAELKVLRGGSWGDTMDNLRSANPHIYEPMSQYHTVGFRCAKTPKSLVLGPLGLRWPGFDRHLYYDHCQ